ncbi:MAG: ABC transporter permease [Acidobacteriota bacterium]
MGVFWNRLRSLLRNGRLDGELDEELEFVFQMEVDANLERGLSPEEARRQARITLGSLESIKEAHRDARGIPWLDNLRRDTIQAVRSYRRTPLFTGVVLITLAVGIGFSTFVFSLMDGILLKPLPYPHAEKIVRLFRNVESPFYLREFASSLYLEDRANQPDSIEAVATFRQSGFNMAGSGEPLRVSGAWATPSFFNVLGIPPYLGRTFSRDDVKSGRSLAVLSYALWQGAFSGERSAIGRKILLDNKPFEIIGVMPEGEDLLDGSSYQLWLPLDLSARPRIRDGFSIDQAQAEVDLWAARMRRTYPGVKEELGLHIEPYFDDRFAEAETHLWILSSAVALVLLLTCVNVAGLLLARGSRRGREVALRSALGAGRSRLVVQFLTESLLLAVPAGILGLGLSYLALQTMRMWSPNGLPRLDNVTLGWFELLFAVTLALVSCLLLGLGPALRDSRARPMTALKQSNLTTTGGKNRGRWNSVLVAGQIALALILMLGAGLFLKSYWELSHVELGFQTENVLTARLDLSQAFTSEAERGSLSPINDRQQERIVDFTGRVMDELLSLPGVESVGVAVAPPLGDWTIGLSGLESEDSKTGDVGSFTARASAVSPGIFEVLGLHLLEGRFFDARDTRSGESTLIVDRMVADRFWPDQSPLGKRLKFGKQWRRTVVGVVGSIHSAGPSRPADPKVYFPFAQYPLLSDVTFLEKGRIGTPQFGREIKRIVAGLEPNLPVYGVETLDDRLDLWNSTEKLVSLLLALFAVVSLFLAAVGLYGTLAFLVSERTQEVGIRMSLGADRARIFRMITFRGLSLVLAGFILGSIGGLAVNYFLAGLVSWDPNAQLIFQAKALDISVFAAVGLLLLLIGFLACAIPALRAARLDPNRALRYE